MHGTEGDFKGKDFWSTGTYKEIVPLNPSTPLRTSKTKMTLQHIGMPAGKDQEGANVGWNQSFDKLAENLVKA